MDWALSGGVKRADSGKMAKLSLKIKGMIKNET
jgi:hypothetical protein